MTWSLPQGKRPGKWHRVTGELRICSNGLHVTNKPVIWFDERCGNEVYEVEIRGERQDEGDDKLCVRSVRLLRRLSDADLASVNIFRTPGEHVVKDGVAKASGSATVTASGSATVTAYDSATVTAYGSATVTASGSATVTSLYGKPVIQLDPCSKSVHIDRRSCRPNVVIAGEPVVSCCTPVVKPN